MKNLAEYRDPPLSVEEFHQLDAKAEKVLAFRERMVKQLTWEHDEYGHRFQKSQLVPSGPEIFPKGEIDERIIKSLCYPAPMKSIIVHFSRLRSHKPYAMGDENWEIIVEDLCKDLHGCSEYAVAKACEYFRKDTSITFFPDTAILQRRIKDLDFSLRNLTAPPKAKKEPEKPADYPRPTDEGKRKIAEILHDASIPHSSQYCVKCKESA